MSVLQELKPITDWHAFNAARWEELLADPAMAAVERRIETNRYGDILMSPNPGIEHGSWQSDSSHLLKSFFKKGRIISECPISTREGVKLADVAWISGERLAKARRNNLLVLAPEICVEILSPANRRGGIEEKKRLYFEGGALEVWIIGLKGRVNFFLRSAPDTPVKSSRLCLEFPKTMDAV